MSLIPRRIFLIQLLILACKLAYSQDTLYFDKDSKPTEKTSASYLRVIKDVPNGFEVNQYTFDGRLTSKETFQDKSLKILNGPAINYYENGNKDSEGTYLNGKRDGEWKFYFDSGKLSASAEFRADKIFNERYYDPHGQVVDSTNAFHEPNFNGGIQAVYKYIANNFNYPKDLPQGIHGKLSVGFVINRQGKVSDVHISKSLNEKLDQEAVRVISSMPDWSPGIQFNRPVNVSYLVPIAL